MGPIVLFSKLVERCAPCLKVEDAALHAMEAARKQKEAEEKKRLDEEKKELDDLGRGLGVRKVGRKGTPKDVMMYLTKVGGATR